MIRARHVMPGADGGSDGSGRPGDAMRHAGERRRVRPSRTTTRVTRSRTAQGCLGARLASAARRSASASRSKESIRCWAICSTRVGCMTSLRPCRSFRRAIGPKVVRHPRACHRAVRSFGVRRRLHFRSRGPLGRDALVCLAQLRDVDLGHPVMRIGVRCRHRRWIDPLGAGGRVRSRSQRPAFPD